MRDKCDFPAQVTAVLGSGIAATGDVASARFRPLAMAPFVATLHDATMAPPPRAVHRTMVRGVERAHIDAVRRGACDMIGRWQHHVLGELRP